MPVNILVADDSVTMRRILELTFQGEDARVTTASDADTAVRKASELSPDIVFADLSLNGMDGYTLATTIKSLPGLERTAVILMASQKRPYDEDKGKAAGVDDHILKPFDTQHVIDRVKQVMGRPRAAPAAGAAASPAAGPAAADRQSRVGGKTIAFGKPPMAMAIPTPAAAPAAMPRPQPQPMAAKPAAPVPPAAVTAATSARTAAGSDLEQKLHGLGLTAEQVQGVLALSRDVIEKVVWEVVPDLAETMIKEEIRRLTAG